MDAPEDPGDREADPLVDVGIVRLLGSWSARGRGALAVGQPRERARERGFVVAGADEGDRVERGDDVGPAERVAQLLPVARGAAVRVAVGLEEARRSITLRGN